MMEDNLITDERLRVEFNDWARAGRGEGMEKGHRPVGEQAIEWMAIPADACVLDVGCGSGWASRLMAGKASNGRVVGIDIADEMIRLARDSSSSFSNIEFQVASAEKLPFSDGEFTHAFSMESLYYYADVLGALKEIRRVLAPGGLFVSVVDLYFENRPSHQWIDELKVPVQLLTTAQYRALFEQAGFVKVRDQRLLDPTQVPENYSGGSFKTREDLIEYRASGSLMMSGEAAS
ncbi:MAG TPA: methyltransferase domain-containing protein [Pyrinomonadaceae bacterium]|nr:methyltransferase domain-containing protein [Pyrinomonadaceae bacterium]